MALDGKVVIGTKVDQSGLREGVKGVETSLAGLKGTIAKLGISALAVAGMKKAVQGFAEFQHGIAKASTLFGDVAVDMDGLEQRMLSLSTASGIATEALNEGLYQALSAGVPATEDMAEATDFLEKAARLSVAGFTDLPTAIDATTKTLNAYGLGVEDAEHIQNILIETQNKGITTVGELGSTLANVTPIAAAFDVSFEQIGASLALLTAKGTQTSVATTQLRAIISELGKDGTTASKALASAAESAGWSETSFVDMMESGKDLGDILAIMDTEAKKNGKSMVDMFSSIEAGQAALSISSDLEKFNENLTTMEGASGSVGEAFDKMDETVSRSLEKIGTAFNNIFISIGGQTEGIIADMVGFVEEAVTGIADAFGENGLSGAIQYWVDSLDTFLPKVFNWAADILVQMGEGIIKNIPNLFKMLSSGISSLISTVFDRRTQVYNIGVGLLESLFKGIIGAAGAFYEGLANLFGIAKVIWENIDWKSLGIDAINAIWEGIKNTFKWFGEKLEAAGDWILEKLSFGFYEGKQTGEEFMEGFFEGSDDHTIDSVDELVDAIGGAFDASKPVWKKTGINIMDAIGGAFGDVEFEKKVDEGVVTPVVEGVETATTALETLDPPVLTVATSLGKAGEKGKELASTLSGPVLLSLEKVGKAVEALDEKGKKTYELMLSALDGFSDVFDEVFTAVFEGGDVWAAFAKAGLEAIASLVDALGHQLAANAALLIAQGDYARGATTGIGAIAAYAAAGLIRGWAGAFATGGVVKGPYTGGDNLTASVKAGETILNHAQTINVARMLDAMERLTKGGAGGLVVAFNGPVYGDEERIATTVYDKIRSLQNEGRLNRW